MSSLIRSLNEPRRSSVDRKSYCVRERIIVVTRQAVTISFTREALLLVPSRYRGIPHVRSLSLDGFHRNQLTLTGFLQSSSILVSIVPRRGASRGPLTGDCYVRKKSPRAKSVDNLNYISHHNPREPVKPTPAFCPGAPRVGSSEWAPACHAEVILPLCSPSLSSAPLASIPRLASVLLRFTLPFCVLHRPC